MIHVCISAYIQPAIQLFRYALECILGNCTWCFRHFSPNCCKEDTSENILSYTHTQKKMDLMDWSWVNVETNKISSSTYPSNPKLDSEYLPNNVTETWQLDDHVSTSPRGWKSKFSSMSKHNLLFTVVSEKRNAFIASVPVSALRKTTETQAGCMSKQKRSSDPNSTLKIKSFFIWK
jgi:hypothetical protein